MAKKNVKRTKKSSPKKRVAKKPARGRRTKKEIPSSTGNSSEETYDVGYGKPPEEHQFQPGDAWRGNAYGQPKARTNLWPFLCAFLSLTPTEFARAKRKKGLTMAQKIAIRVVEDIHAGVPAALKLFNKWIDRDEGRPAMSVHVEPKPPELTESETQILRDQLAQNALFCSHEWKELAAHQDGKHTGEADAHPHCPICSGRTTRDAA